MNKKILAISIVTAFAWAGSTNAKADLDDTYAQSCQKYGGPGRVYREQRVIMWRSTDHWIQESFVKNRCVAIMLIPDAGLAYKPDDMINFLPYESAKLWKHIAGPNGQFQGSWETVDGTVLASLYVNGRTQVAYKWFLERKGLVDDLPAEPDYGRAPIEDNGEGTQM